MGSKFLSLLLVFTFLSSAVFAETPLEKHQRRQRAVNDPDYEFTLHLCEGDLGYFMLINDESIQDANKNFLKFNSSADEEAPPFPISPRLKKLLESEAYYTALEDCYPGDIDKQMRVSYLLALEDSAGKILNEATFGALWVMLGNGISKVVGYAATLLKLSARTMKITKWSAIGVSGASLVSTHYLKKYMAKQKQERFDEVAGKIDQLNEATLRGLNKDITDDESKLRRSDLSIEDRKATEEELSHMRNLRDRILVKAK